jgi:hypothetical protein
MLSPMQEHMARVKKAQAVKEIKENKAAATAPAKNTDTNYSEFEVLTAAVESDVTALNAKPKQERNAVRKTLVDRYMGHIEAYLQAGIEYANPVLVYMVMWLFDLGRIADATRLGLIALQQNQKMIKTFKRPLATFIFDEVLAWAEAENKNGKSNSPYFSQFLDLLDEHELPDIVKMKYYKLAGNMAFDEKDMATAEKYYVLAIEAEPAKAKVDIKLKTARKALEKLTAKSVE